MTQNEDFFKERKPPAILKHGILREYGQTFAQIVGKRAPGRRVVLVDRFAGQPYYEDGNPCSPTILSDLRAELQPRRDLDFVCIELHDEPFQKLATAFPDRALKGGFSGHVDEILQRALDVPLLAYIDPFGRPPDTSDLVGIFRARPRPQVTELLVHFSWNAMRNAFLGYDSYTAALGGDWYREIAERKDDGWQREIVRGYIKRLCAQVEGLRGHDVDVRKRWGGAVQYSFVLFTQNPKGSFTFVDVLPAAFQEFYEEDQEYWAGKAREQAEAQGQFSLFDSAATPDPVPRRSREMTADVWRIDIQRRLRMNILALLVPGQQVRLGDAIEPVYAGVKGFAREKDVKEAARAAGCTIAGSKDRMTITMPR